MPKALIPSPDAVFVEAVDRLLSIPQRRGIPLPAVLVPVAFVSPFAMMAFAVCLWSLGGGALALIWAGVATFDALLASATSRSRLGDARAWTPQKAQSYRASALAAREAGRLMRSMDVAMVTVGLVAMVTVTLDFRHPAAVSVVGVFLLWTVGQGIRNFSDCAMPHDPDVTRRATAPTAA